MIVNIIKHFILVILAPRRQNLCMLQNTLCVYLHQITSKIVTALCNLVQFEFLPRWAVYSSSGTVQGYTRLKVPTGGHLCLWLWEEKLGVLLGR
jgi:hypothetical protein